MNKVANALLKTGAVHIKPAPEDFFTWTSGKRSPIYCDNRVLIAFPQYRKIITEEFVKILKKKHPQTELIAGTATAGIPWAAWLADELELPMVYIRSKPKGHGMQTAIEGKCGAGQKTVIIEDLISTGKSSIESYKHCLGEQLEVQGVLSIFSYDLPIADIKFKQSQLEKTSLCTLNQLLEYAKSEHLLNERDVGTVCEWRLNF